MDDARPEASVVIPTHDRRNALLACLEALAVQTLPADRFEVIVALDAVTDDSAEAVAARRWPFPLRTVAVAARNAAATRNAGAALARAPRLVFLDDDIRVVPGFLAAHLAAAGPEEDRVVVGHSAPDIVGTGWFHEGLAGWWSRRFDDLADPAHRFAHSDLMSGNVSLPRALFERLGGFDATLPLREDYELGYRAIAAGAPMTYAADALGLHRDESDMRRNLQRVRTEGGADVAFARRHPEAFPALRAAGLAAPTRSSRLLRFLNFRAPALVEPTLAAIEAVLPVLERLRLRRLWTATSLAGWGLGYHRGVALAVGSEKGLRALATAAAAAAPVPRRLRIDLTDRVEDALAAVEATRPDDCVIHVGARQVARYGAWPGLEPLGRRHVEGWLRAAGDRWAPHVSAAKRLPPLPGSGSAAIPAEGWSVGELTLDDWSLRPVRTPLSLPLVTLVRLQGQPLGWIWLEADAMADGSGPAVRSAVLANRAICENILRVALAPVAGPSGRPPISVVVCTRDRAESLAECLDALAALDYSDHEVVVVDNAPSTDVTARLVASRPGVRYVREDRPGLDWARNRGVAAARHGLIAFTDDDTRADRLWLHGIARAFDDPGVAAVTGLVGPMELASEAQRYFELVYGGMGKGFRPRRWSRAANGARGILWASGCGVGANMAFRREALDRVGPFDPALDVGTATRGGGDIEMFHRVLAAGLELQYAPDAMVWHRHRNDWEGLARQLADNGSGFAAYLMAAWRGRTVPRHVVLRFAAQDWIWGWLATRLIRPGAHRRDFVRREVSGLLRSPGRMRRARSAAAELAAAPIRTAPPPQASDRSVDGTAEP